MNDTIQRAIIKERFIQEKGISADEFNKNFIVLPCGWSLQNSDGYDVFSRDPVAIKTYLESNFEKDIKFSSSDLYFLIVVSDQYNKIYNNDEFYKKVMSIPIKKTHLY